MEFKLFNTLTRSIEPFVPFSEKRVSIYSCGPTVYWFLHVGNLRAYITADTLKRTLRYAGYEVFHVMNITDVGHLTSDGDEGEDKMLVAMQREGKSAWDIAKFYTEACLQDFAALNIEMPSVVCKATDHIKEQIELIERLEANGFAYRTSDGVYFDTSKFNEYGKLAKLNIEGLEAGKRVELGDKRNKTDFALWKLSPTDKQRDMEWESPWGKGFPGWHIECSAMAMKYLGEQFDIHTGGIDHIPVHHTNEIAQSECASGKKPFVKYWVHNEFVVLDHGEKMSKSKANFLTITRLQEEQGIHPLAYRFFILSSHYRMPLTFSADAIESAQRAYERLVRNVVDLKSKGASIKDTLTDAGTRYQLRFRERILDDMDTPGAVAVLWEVLKATDINADQKFTLVCGFDEIFGLKLRDIKEEEVEVPSEVAKLLEMRTLARKEKRWADSDSLRDQINALGFDVVDTKEGASVKPRR